MDVMMIFDIVMIGIGIYMVFTAWGMKQKNKISSILLAEEELVKCQDEVGFVTYIFGKEIVMGVALVSYGAVGLLDKFVFQIGGVLDYVSVVILLMVFFWFYKGLQNARSLFLR
ncbi:MAG: hypothetical protein IKU39_02375 [Lachnospiraceae bacterium]|nr:hypothetical protein [Lachnospiraceae bacterium]